MNDRVRFQRAPCHTAGRYLEGIEGAAEDQQAVVAQRGDHGQVGGVADEVDLPDAGVVMDHLPGKAEGNRKWQQMGLFPVGWIFFFFRPISLLQLIINLNLSYTYLARWR